jgi:hypothetical protein
MTVRAIVGLVVYNAFLLAVGAGVLWGIRGWRWWTELFRLAGVAYLLGVASLMMLLTFELVIGVPVGAFVIVLSGAGLVALGLVAGHLLRRPAPARRPDGWQVPGISLFAALFAAGIIVYLEALFRSDRLSGIAHEWDSWAFWMPKAKSLYFFGRLEPDFLASLPQLPSYPPGLALIQAGALHAIGSADTTSLHVQHWFFAVGFVAAVVGLLAGRVRHAILLPTLLVFLVSPSLVGRATTLYADVPLGYLLAVAALLVLLWIRERELWLLAGATVLLGGAMLTKREGLLFVACILLAAFVTTWTERRELWPRLAVAGVIAFVATVPWRIWFVAHGLEGDGPDDGYIGAFNHLDRVWPSFKLAVRTLVDYDVWGLAPFAALGAIAIAVLAGAYREAVYAGSFVCIAIAGATWAIWAYTALPITQDDGVNPIIRITGSTVLVLAALTPVLLDRAWSAMRTPAARPSYAVPGRDAFVWRSRWLWAVVAVGLLSHPGAMLVGFSKSGLPGGAPAFPSAEDCVRDPVPDRNVRVVIGYASSYPSAYAIRRRAVAAGMEGVEVARDGCGRLRVYVDDVLRGEAERRIALARAADLDPTLEAVPDG